MTKKYPNPKSENSRRLRAVAYSRVLAPDSCILASSSGLFRHSSFEIRHFFTAFTLLELIVVIAVVALLSLTFVPVFAKSSNTKALQCINNQRQLCAGWRMYADDNNQLLVSAGDDSNPSSSWNLWPINFDPGNAANWDTNVDIVNRPLWPYSGNDASIYKCSSDRSFVIVSGVAKLRVRSLAMNWFLGGQRFPSSYTNYLSFPKLTDMPAPGPAQIFVFLDMRPDVTIWGNFITEMTGYPNAPTQYEFVDFPGFYHNLGCTFSFADGRAEVHRWRDQRTMPPLVSASSSPRNPDIAWLQDHATRPK